MKKIIGSAIALALTASSFVVAQDQDAAFDSLLKKVRDGRISESAAHKQRENEFLANKNLQAKLVTDARAEKARLERESTRLERVKRDNKTRMDQLIVQRVTALGQLQELFGVLQQASGDMRSVVVGSQVSIDNPGRLDGINNLIAKASDEAALPTLDEIRVLPHAMMIEMRESRNVASFEQEVYTASGNVETIELTRVGDFTLMSGEKYYTHTMVDGVARVEELARQPAGRFTETIADLQASTGDTLTAVGVDPSRGQILRMSVNAPTLEERLDQGGIIGYLILGLGAIGVLLAVIQYAYLFMVSQKVKAQIRNPQANVNNPLGRVLGVYQANPAIDVETLELKLDEAILKETPALERFLTLIKLISAVAPLFGLLGTVVGMIATFQAITLFGTGDPKMMAAGISTALMTTVEGLVVAIPTLLLHSFVAGSSKSVIHVLEEQSAGIIAVHAEKGAANASA